MADSENHNTGLELPTSENILVQPTELETALGESLANTLNLDTWKPGENLNELYGRLEREVRQAVEQEGRIRDQIRADIFPRLSSRPGAPSGAGVYAVPIEKIQQIHKSLLFNGAVEACDATSVVHDTLPVTITQIGVCLVSYRGDQGSWVHRVYRRDLRLVGMDPAEEALAMLERRRLRGSTDAEDKRDNLSQLARRGIMAYAERAVLLKKSDSLWRMGHGNPVPYELLTGSGSMELLEASLDVLKELVNYKRFVFVPSAPRDRVMLTIGNALYPMEFAIVDNASEQMRRVVENGHYAKRYKDMAMEFVNDVGSKIIAGVYRASRSSPAFMFYAHEDCALEAALIAMGDSALQEHRGFPMLIDLGDSICRTFFDTDSFTASVREAYADAGAPFQYLRERETRW
jgi:hypothetical protein